MAVHVVCAIGELPPGSRKIVELEGRSIGVFNIDGEFFAIRNRCPHQGAELCLGQLGSRVEASKPGEYVWRTDSATIRCPWHLWEFEIRTGESCFDPVGVRVKSYDVRVETFPTRSEDGRVVVELQDAGRGDERDSTRR